MLFGLVYLAGATESEIRGIRVLNRFMVVGLVVGAVTGTLLSRISGSKRN